MRALAQLSPWTCLALVACAISNSCSSSDVSLGETRRKPPTPTPEPTPGPVPDPTPTPDPTPGPTPTPSEYPCEVVQHGTCLAPTAHCSGRFTTRAGYECDDNTVCCEISVGGTPPGAGGAAGAGGS